MIFDRGFVEVEFLSDFFDFEIFGVVEVEDFRGGGVFSIEVLPDLFGSEFGGDVVFEVE